MQQWLGIDPLATFTLRRIEARGWHVSAHFVNGTVELHAVRVDTHESHVGRCDDGDDSDEQRCAAELLARAVGLI